MKPLFATPCHRGNAAANDAAIGISADRDFGASLAASPHTAVGGA
ncbi:hypothetical protein AB4Y32_19045 [Paraburkholderia phymatum]|uniref:Uncharacterized protein n=1 Tax=Paraburkholderia phymatum TaxID=148447 RepID=A0ACC6U2F1_9BURK